jgi:hypothetical protein
MKRLAESADSTERLVAELAEEVRTLKTRVSSVEVSAEVALASANLPPPGTPVVLNAFAANAFQDWLATGRTKGRRPTVKALADYALLLAEETPTKISDQDERKREP